jgi:hypothetical protein
MSFDHGIVISYLRLTEYFHRKSYNTMNSFYKCSCGYTTKNSEYAHFHNNNIGCEAVKYNSAFEGSGGLVVMIMNSKTSRFFKWYDTEEKLVKTYPDAIFRYSCDCDREFIKMLSKAVHDGIVSSYDVKCPIVRNDSAERLFKSYHV